MPLTYVGAVSGSFGGLSIHANFVWDDDGIHVMDGNVVRGFQVTGVISGVFTRRAQLDITLSGHPTSLPTWGFTEWLNGDWVVMTREARTDPVTGEVFIGKVYVYSHDGSEQKLVFEIPDRHPDVSGETFRAPKGIAEWNDEYHVRVVRSVAGNMRFIHFDRRGNLLESVVLEESSPSAVRDITAEHDTPLYVGERGSPVGIVYAINPLTGAEIQGERAVGADIANMEGIYVHGTHLYVATLTSIEVYSGVPHLVLPSSGGGGGFPFSFAEMVIRNEWLGRDLRNRRRQR